MPITQSKAEKLGWIFQPGENLQTAEKMLQDGRVVRQQSVTLPSLLTAVESYEDLQARIETSEPVTFERPPLEPNNDPVNTFRARQKPGTGPARREAANRLLRGPQPRLV